MLILPMYGSLPARDQLKVFQRTPSDTRKIIVATNIAETSITISGIVYGKWTYVHNTQRGFHLFCNQYIVLYIVVDCGFVKMRWFNSESFTDSLVVVPTSKASAEQRAGRAGRTKPGKVYRYLLFFFKEYNF